MLVSWRENQKVGMLVATLGSVWDDAKAVRRVDVKAVPRAETTASESVESKA